MQRFLLPQWSLRSALLVHEAISRHRSGCMSSPQQFPVQSYLPFPFCSLVLSLHGKVARSLARLHRMRWLLGGASIAPSRVHQGFPPLYLLYEGQHNVAECQAADRCERRERTATAAFRNMSLKFSWNDSLKFLFLKLRARAISQSPLEKRLRAWLENMKN